MVWRFILWCFLQLAVTSSLVCPNIILSPQHFIYKNSGQCEKPNFIYTQVKITALYILMSVFLSDLNTKHSEVKCSQIYEIFHSLIGFLLWQEPEFWWWDLNIRQWQLSISSKFVKGFRWWKILWEWVNKG
jgi:hypothetical protein